MKPLAFVLLTIIGAFSVIPAHAQDHAAPQSQAAATTNVDPAALAVAQELVKSLDMKNLMQNVTSALLQSMVPLIDQENPGQGEKVRQIAGDALQKVMTAHLPELEKNKAIVYAQLFTVPELEQLKKFYASPVGQKTLQSTGEIMRRNAALDQSIMMETVQESRRQMLDQLKKNGMKIPKAMGV